MLSGNLGLPNKKNCGKDSFFRLENCNPELNHLTGIPVYSYYRGIPAKC